MMRKLAATSLIALTALAACGADDDGADDSVDETPIVSAPDDTDSDDGEDADSDDVMTVDDGVATSTDGRVSLPIADGWQAYPAPLDERVNVTVLLVSDVDNAEFAANIIGTWADPVPGVPENYEEWRAAADNVFTGEDVTVDDAEKIDIDGESVEGLEVTSAADGIQIKQLVYPIFTDEGFQEIAFSASPDVFEENVDDVVSMISELTINM